MLRVVGNSMDDRSWSIADILVPINSGAPAPLAAHEAPGGPRLPLLPAGAVAIP